MFPGICRVWDKKKKEWVESQVVIEPTLGNSFNPFYKLSRGEEYPDTIQQYWTGLYDFTEFLFGKGCGKRIYEGDIVQGFFIDGHPRIPFVIKYDVRQCKFNLSQDLINSRRVRVIGNVVQNPELIPEEYRRKIIESIR